MKLVHRELVFKVIEFLGWTVEVDPYDDLIPEIAATCDEDTKTIWVNGTAAIDDQIRAALYLTQWPNEGSVDLRPNTYYHWSHKLKFPQIDFMLQGIFAGAVVEMRKAR